MNVDTHSQGLKSALDLLIDFLLSRDKELVEVFPLDALSPDAGDFKVGQPSLVDEVVDGLSSDPDVIGGLRDS